MFSDYAYDSAAAFNRFVEGRKAAVMHREQERKAREQERRVRLEPELDAALSAAEHGAACGMQKSRRAAGGTV